MAEDTIKRLTVTPSASAALETGKGILTTLGRMGAVYALSFAGSIVLARLLSPRDFGIYAVSTFLVDSIFRFSNLGLGAALVQQREAPTAKEMRTVFTCQFLVVTGGSLLIAALATILSRIFRLDVEAAWLVRLLTMTWIIGTLVSNSRILLTRRLDFATLASIDIAESVLYQAAAVFLAFLGYGYWSFGLAALFSGLAGNGIAFVKAPWPIGVAWDKAAFRRTFAFGARFQLSGMSSIFRDSIINLLGGPLYGPQVVGYLNWGRGNAERFGHAITQAVAQVAFPGLCRTRDDPRLTEKLVERMMSHCVLVAAPCLAIVSALLPQIIIVVYTAKWLPASTAFYCFACRYLMANLITPLDAFLKASGRVSDSVRIMWVWTAAEWVLALVIVNIFGSNGIAVSYALGSFMGAYLLHRALHEAMRVKLAPLFLRPVAAAVLAGLGVWTLANLVLGGGRVQTITWLIGLGLMGVVLYGVCLAVLGGGSLAAQALQDVFRIARQGKTGRSLSGSLVAVE